MISKKKRAKPWIFRSKKPREGSPPWYILPLIHSYEHPSSKLQRVDEFHPYLRYEIYLLFSCFWYFVVGRVWYCGLGLYSSHVHTNNPLCKLCKPNVISVSSLKCPWLVGSFRTIALTYQYSVFGTIVREWWDLKRSSHSCWCPKVWGPNHEATMSKLGNHPIDRFLQTDDLIFCWDAPGKNLCCAVVFHQNIQRPTFSIWICWFGEFPINSAKFTKEPRFQEMRKELPPTEKLQVTENVFLVRSGHWKLPRPSMYNRYTPDKWILQPK